jgi:hypothetical protein
MRVRGVAAFILVILTALGVTASAIAWWVHYVALDTDAFMEIVEPAVTSDEFTHALGTRLAEETVTALDLETRFTNRLTALDEYIREELVQALDPGPTAQALIDRLDVPSLADLAVPLSAAANERITEAIVGLTASEEFRSAMTAVIRRGHETGVALITDDLESLPNVYVEGEDVKWNALPLVTAAIRFVIEKGILGGEEISLPDLSDNPIASAAIERLRAALSERIPDDLGQITVMSTDDLAALQGIGDAFDRGLWLLIILTVVLLAVTLIVSPRRRRTVVQLGVATVIAIVIAGLAVRAAVNAVQGRIVSAEGRAAATSVLAQLQDSAQAVGITILLIAILVGILAWLGGRPEQIARWIEVGRHAVDRQREPSRMDLFVGRWFDLLAVVVIILALVLMWAIGLDWLWTLVILALVGIFVWYAMSARARYELDQDVEGTAPPTEQEPEHASDTV